MLSCQTRTPLGNSGEGSKPSPGLHSKGVQARLCRRLRSSPSQQHRKSNSDRTLGDLQRCISNIRCHASVKNSQSRHSTISDLGSKLGRDKSGAHDLRMDAVISPPYSPTAVMSTDPTRLDLSTTSVALKTISRSWSVGKCFVARAGPAMPPNLEEQPLSTCPRRSSFESWRIHMTSAPFLRASHLRQSS